MVAMGIFSGDARPAPLQLGTREAPGVSGNDADGCFQIVKFPADWQLYISIDPSI